MKHQIDWGALYAALESQREVEGRSWADIASDLDLDIPVFTLLSQGKPVDGDSLVTLTSWLDVQPDSFVIGDQHAAGASQETRAAVSSYLRINSGLKPRSAEAIETVLRAAYAQLGESAGPATK
jgi:hypothetical protein